MEGFRPAGDTILVNGFAPGASPGATALGSTAIGGNAYRVFNQGFRDAFVGFGMTSDDAAAGSVIPVIGAGSKAQSVPAGTVVHIVMGRQNFVAARAVMESTNIFVTPGHIVPPNA